MEQSTPESAAPSNSMIPPLGFIHGPPTGGWPLEPDPEADSLVLNEVGRVALRTNQPLFIDSYESNRATGSFILIDEATNNTVAAGMILLPESSDPIG